MEKYSLKKKNRKENQIRRISRYIQYYINSKISKETSANAVQLSHYHVIFSILHQEWSVENIKVYVDPLL